MKKLLMFLLMLCSCAVPQTKPLANYRCFVDVGKDGRIGLFMIEVYANDIQEAMEMLEKAYPNYANIRCALKTYKEFK